MRRMILVPLLIVIAILAVGGGITYYIWDNYTYYRTDDAAITGNIVSVSAPTSGELTALSVKTGDTVTAGQTIATITPLATSGTAAAPQPIDVTSPINGTILPISLVQGQMVSPGLPIAQLTDLNTITITANIDENAISNVKVGQDVDIHIDAFGDTSFTGHVQQLVKATAASFSLLPSQDNSSGNFTKVGQRIPVIITLDGNSGKEIVPGMSAEVTIHIH